jgi:hypothetical protein
MLNGVRAQRALRRAQSFAPFYDKILFG